MSLSLPVTKKKILEETLDVISSQVNLNEFQGLGIEFIVVNDGEDVLDELTEKYKSIPLKIIKNLKKGAASARNTGVKYSKGEIILFHDDDILPGPYYFKRHIEVHQRHSKIILIANWVYPEHLINKGKTTSFGRYRLYFNKYISFGDQLHKTMIEQNLYEVDGMATFSCSMKRSVYEDVGPFNEMFEYAGCEDAEFSYRAMQKGYRCIYDEKNICYHNELDNFELYRWLQRQSRGIKSAVVMCKLHPEGKAHPTWYTNTPLQWADPFDVKILKIKKWLLSRKLVEKILFGLVWFLEKIKAPDKILFRLYNALWLGNTYRSFREAYKRLFSSEQRPLPPL